MKKTLLFLLLVSVSVPLSAQMALFKKKYNDKVGDIPFDKALDDPSFQPCNEARALPYNIYGGALRIKGDKYRVIQHFVQGYSLGPVDGQTGYITIRFMVNCKGQTGRFRLYQMDMNGQTAHFEAAIQQRLMSLCKSLDGWEIQYASDKDGIVTNFLSPSGTPGAVAYDYYQQLTIKLKDGQIEQILP